MTARRPFLFLSANTPWVYALAHRLGADVPVRAVRVFDWGVYYRQRPAWPPGPPSAHLTRTTRVMPTGYTGLLEPLVRPFAQWFVGRWQRALQAKGGGEPASAEPIVVAPYPYLAPWVRRVPGDRLVYYNLDDYVLYRPERAAQITAQEDELVRRAHRTVCLSQHQVEALRARHPRRAHRIHHFPLGVTEAFVNPAPEAPPAPRTVGYVGNLSDRVDWTLVNATAARCPDLTFRFVGGADPEARATPWERARAEAFRRPNVDYVGRVPQEAVAAHYWSFAVNWIPYDAAHPFNRAACPTKIMDGLGSGRPMVSTPVPECRLYPAGFAWRPRPKRWPRRCARRSRRPRPPTPPRRWPSPAVTRGRTAPPPSAASWARPRPPPRARPPPPSPRLPPLAPMPSAASPTPPPASRWIVAQIGAREHYAVPRALHRAGALRRLYTDAWCPVGRNLLRRLPEPARSLAGRYHPALAEADVRAFTLATLARTLRRRLLGAAGDEAYYRHHLAVGRAFAEPCATTWPPARAAPCAAASTSATTPAASKRSPSCAPRA